MTDRRGKTSHQSHKRRRSCGASGSGCSWCAESCTGDSMKWRDEDDGLVVLEGRGQDLLQRMHRGGTVAHLGTARTLTLVEQGFYWSGTSADASRACRRCDCVLLKTRRGSREPLHQYIVGIPMERLAMDVPNHLLRKPVLPDGGMLFLEMARVFPHSQPESHNGGTEIGVRNSGALRSLPGTPQRSRYKFWVKAGARGLLVVWHLQDADDPVPPKEQ